MSGTRLGSDESHFNNDNMKAASPTSQFMTVKKVLTTTILSSVC
jgi:hypothetical protein